MDYSIYLSQPFFFVLFQILILLVTVYAMAQRFKFGTTQEWMGAATPAGKDPQSAECRYADYRRRKAVALHRYVLRCKSILANYVLFGRMNIPFSRRLVADEHRNGTVYHGYAGIGGADILSFQDSLYHQRGVNGGYLSELHCRE